MTYILSIDPGVNTGAAIGFYDAITPYQLVERHQIHGGVRGFIEWWKQDGNYPVDEIVCESFELREENDFAADLTPVKMEGALETLLFLAGVEQGVHIPFTYQSASKKGSLVPYPAWCRTKTQRQRFRFDFLDRFGLFKPGTEFDDSNDAITHGLVYLKGRRHAPTLAAFWPQMIRPAAVPVPDGGF